MNFRYVIIAFLLLGFQVMSYAQTVTLEDDFEDQDLSQNPEWFGDLDDFTFTQENDNTLLQLDAESDPSRTQIRTSSATAYGSWEFFIRQSANTSTQNRVYVYLMADDENLNRLDGSPVNGYAIHTGSGRFDLVRIDNGNDTVILSSDTEIEPGEDYQVRVTRDEDDEWQIHVSEGYGSTPEEDSGTVTDDTYTESRYFGFFLRYSAAQTQNYFFDDVRVESTEDFEAVQAEVSGPQTVDISYNFPVDESSVDEQNFDISEYGTPESAELTENNVTRLDIGEQWEDGDYTVTINDIESEVGQTLEPDTELDFDAENPFEVVAVEAVTDQRIEVELTEAADEDEIETSDFNVDGVGEPSAIAFEEEGELIALEYDPLDLGDYTLTIEGIPAESGWRLPQPAEFEFEVENPFFVEDVKVRSREEIEVKFSEAVDVDETEASDFSVDGVGEPQALAFEDDDRVAILDYEPLDPGEYTLIIEAIPSESGWTLPQPAEFDFEIINPFTLDELEVISDEELRLQFTQDVEAQDVEPENFEVDGVGNPGEVERPDSDDELFIRFDDPLESGQYTLIIAEITSVEGWDLPQPAEFDFSILDEFEGGDIVLNEFMYRSPPDGMSRYVELYNHTDKLLDISDWELRRRADAPNPGGAFIEEETVLGPDEYVVISPDTTTLFETFGSRNYIKMDNYPGFTSTVADEIRLFTDDGTRADSLRYNPSTWGGNGVALERISPTAISTSRDNWEESPADEGGTPGAPNLVEPDDEAPEFVRLNAPYADTLIAEFSKSVTEPTAVDPDNYEISGSGDPEISELEIREASDQVSIAIDRDMESGQTYSVTASGIEDLFGNASEEETQEVTWFVTEPADSSDVFVNEFMYDAPDDYSRYIELYNPSDKAIDIAGWTYNNDTGTRRTITEDRTIIPPESYKVFGPDESLLDIFPDMDFVHMSNFPALKTGGDNLVIRDDEGMLIDSLTYTPAWGGDEVALERRSTDIPAYIQDNWGDSPADALGTPGEPNQVEPLDQAPEVVGVTAVLDDRIRIIFNRTISEETGTELQNFELSDGLDITNIRYRNEEIFLDVDPTLESGREYDLTLRDLEDLIGNVIEEQTHTFSYQEFEPAEERDVVINEFLYRPVDGEITRFVELYNRSDRDINLDEWQIGRGTGSPITLRGTSAPDGETLPIALPSGEYIVITPDDSWVDDTAEYIHEVSSIPSFSSLGDAFFIRNDEGTRVDSLRYSTSWGGNQPGLSLERHDPNAASNDPANWATNSEGHTAGFENKNFEPDETPPELIFAGVRANNTLRVYFDQHISLDDDETRFQLAGEELEVERFDRHNANTLTLSEPGESLPEDEDIDIEATHLRDVAGNVTESDQKPVARPIDEGDVVINEIMYQPISDRYSDRPDQSEYLEFYNKQPYAVSLEGIFIHDKPDKDDETSDINPTSTSAKWIPSEGYAVMHGDQSTNFEDTRLARFFELESDRHVIRANRTSLSLSASGDDVYLADSNRTVIDQVSYDPDWHNRNIADVRGRALERKRPSGDSNDSRNWSTTTNQDGGTPLDQNTIFSEPEALPEDEGLALDPDPFAPNADGRDDNLNISWQLEESDYLMRIRIYDRHGRKVRTLADGEQAGMEGTVTWDGMKDDGTENRVGFYIILFEAYNSSNGSNRTFRETVVLAREM